MAENPDTWGEAEKVISAAISENMALDPDICGVTVEKMIADALREAGLLTEYKPHPGGGAHVCSCGRRVQ